MWNKQCYTVYHSLREGGSNDIHDISALAGSLNKNMLFENIYAIIITMY